MMTPPRGVADSVHTVVVPFGVNVSRERAVPVPGGPGGPVGPVAPVGPAGPGGPVPPGMNWMLPSPLTNVGTSPPTRELTSTPSTCSPTIVVSAGPVPGGNVPDAAAGAAAGAAADAFNWS